MTVAKLPSLTADIRLSGNVSEQMVAEFLAQKTKLEPGRQLLLELSTSGGDADLGRRLALEMRLLRESEGRDVYFLGKTFVFSAGITIMSAFPPDRRFLTADCELLIHERRMKTDVHIEGPLRSCESRLNEVLREIESGKRLQREGFAKLVEGSRLSLAELESKVMSGDWYVTAAQASDMGLIAGIV